MFSYYYTTFWSVCQHTIELLLFLSYCAELLAEVYLELLGGAEPSMELRQEENVQKSVQEVEFKKVYREPRSFPLTEEENSLHTEFLTNKIKNAVWLNEG